MKRVTIKDVAQSACVSTSTVSHVINNSRFVDPLTKARVIEAMEELHYNPDFFARGMRSGVSKTIGLIVPDTSSPFYAELSHKMEEYGYRSGYSVIFCNSGNDPGKETNYIKTLVAKRVDGIIFIGSDGNNPESKIILENQIPTVVSGQDSNLEFSDVVTVDYSLGALYAIKYLAGLGHKRIACISIDSPELYADDWKADYLHAMHSAGLDAPLEYYATGAADIHGGEDAMEILLNLKERPTAVVCFNDLMAIGAMVRTYKHGFKIPDDMSIIGFDDIHFSECVVPGLTTIAQPMGDIARITIQLIIDRLKGDRKSERRKIILDPELVIRGSTSRRE